MYVWNRCGGVGENRMCEKEMLSIYVIIKGIDGFGGAGSLLFSIVEKEAVAAEAFAGFHRLT